ncbi:CRAL_TRIO domain-containing protein/CRAL_TRIO_N domain-containing protein [Cephalotus follicularis]|uniref:CRAL_TRIO domain-containing protein/CRAL_TRIO_N domain-containing protein n=1 Tax=Cephalotus follicularis TaxID=3775 RepID=A0A1Q3BCI9_CEPFO|nr:CRAL_TRIO domain-containing protein/CRAL_TRIO_N domain-containing protein [Cephalotus follicularis]
MTVEVKVEETQKVEDMIPQEEPKKVIEETEKVVDVEAEVEVVDDDSKPKTLLEKSSSYKEESNFLSDLKEYERRALNEFKSKLEEAILANTLFTKVEPKNMEKAINENEEKEKEKQVTEEKAKDNETKESEKPVQEEAKPKEGDVKEAIEEEAKLEEEDVKEATEEEAKPEDGDVKEVTQTLKCEEEKKPEELEVEEKGEGEEDKEIALWGVPLLPSKRGEGTDVVLLKFLRAREFKVNEAFEMLKKTLQWRKDANIDSVLEENFGADLSSAAYMNGVDREGHPVCYNIYGVFDNEEFYQKTFGTEEKREQFLRWRFQLMEKGIQKLNLKPGGVTSLLQINDLKSSPGLSKKDLRIAMKQVVALLQDNYPEFVARNIFINVPFWYYALNALLSPFLTQRTKSKFVVARPAKVTETLLKYIPAEEIPVQYGGFKREDDFEFSSEDGAVSELAIKANSTATIEITSEEVGTTLIWDISVLGWEVNYKEEFVPSDEGSYSIIVKKGKKMSSTQEGPIRNNFISNEPGKLVLTIENASNKKKRVLYRYKTKKSSSSF